MNRVEKKKKERKKKRVFSPKFLTLSGANHEHGKEEKASAHDLIDASR